MTTQTHFKAALSEIRKSGVKVKQNVQQCCRSCVTPEQLGMTEESEKVTPYLWTYAGQGRRYFWQYGEAYRKVYRNDRPAEAIYFYFGDNILAPEIAYRIFKEHGFDVEWNFTHAQALKLYV